MAESQVPEASRHVGEDGVRLKAETPELAVVHAKPVGEGVDQLRIGAAEVMDGLNELLIGAEAAIEGGGVGDIPRDALGVWLLRRRKSRSCWPQSGWI